MVTFPPFCLCTLVVAQCLTTALTLSPAPVDCQGDLHLNSSSTINTINPMYFFQHWLRLGHLSSVPVDLNECTEQFELIDSCDQACQLSRPKTSSNRSSPSWVLASFSIYTVAQKTNPKPHRSKNSPPFPLHRKP
jgi:hypothetical protein